VETEVSNVKIPDLGALIANASAMAKKTTDRVISPKGNGGGQKPRN